MSTVMAVITKNRIALICRLCRQRIRALSNSVERCGCPA